MKFRLLLAALLGLTCAWAQTAGGGGAASGGASAPSTGGGATGGGAGTGAGTGTGTGTGTSGRPTNPSTITNPAQQVPTPIQRPKIIFLSGEVAMDDGSALPGSVKIQSVCGTSQKSEAYTSARGEFSFQWGETRGIFEDASSSGRANSSFNTNSTSGSGSASGLSNPLSNCELKVDAPGYVSSRVPLFQYASQDRIDVGIISLHRITGEEGNMVSLLSMKAPKAAKKAYEKGNDQFRSKKFNDAAASFQKAVAAYPEYADAWLNLGRTEVQLGNRDAAREHFQKAMDLDKKLLGPWQELGYLASDASKWEDAARYLDQAVKLDPMNSPMAWYFSAMADYNLGRYEAAEKSIRAEIRLDGDRNPRARFLLGVILMARQDMTGGAEALRSFLKTSPTGPEVEMAKRQLLRAEGTAARK